MGRTAEIFQTSDLANIRLSLVHKMMLGALGALTPAIINLYVVDFEELFHSQPITPAYVIGYLVRILILILYGSLIAFFNRDEKNPVKLFQLGAAFPAIITIMLSVGKVPPPSTTAAPKPTGRTAMGWLEWVVPAAQAQPGPTLALIVPKEFCLAKDRPIEQFWKGFMGYRVEEQSYAVVIPDEMDWQTILYSYYAYVRLYPHFDFEIYRSPTRTDLFMLVLATNQTLPAAYDLKHSAELSGMSLVGLYDLSGTPVEPCN